MPAPGNVLEVKDSKSELLSQPVDMVSLDYDGTLEVSEWEDCPDRHMFYHIIRSVISNTKPSKILLMVGSNRQSHSIEVYNHNLKYRLNGYCNRSLLKLAHQLNQAVKPHDGLPIVDIVPYLLADTNDKLPHGESFCRSLAEQPDCWPSFLKHAEMNADCLLDQWKISLLYAQIHKFACENPGARNFYFFDDNTEILESLHTFFSFNNGMFMPKGITLHLHKVSLMKNSQCFCTPLEPITGQGAKDLNWENNIKIIAPFIRDLKKQFLFISDPSIPQRLAQLSSLLNKAKSTDQYQSRNLPDKHKRLEELKARVREQINISLAQRKKRIDLYIKALEEKEAKEVEYTKKRNKANYIKWVISNIIKPIDNRIVIHDSDIKDAENKKDEHKLKISSEKHKLFVEAKNKIVEEINARDKPLNEIQSDVIRTVDAFSQTKINGSKNRGQDFFRVLLGILLTPLTVGFCWLSDDYRNTFWHTKSQKVANDLTSTIKKCRI